MNTIIYFSLNILLAFFTCYQSDNDNIRQNLNLTSQEKIVKQNVCITQADAEKILGQSAKLTENSSESKNGITKFRCTYTTNITGSKISNLYYLLEEFKNITSAQKTYTSILKQNENMPGLKKLNEPGDQAFLHTDNENFLMIIVRKNNKILRLKVNKLTNMTSSKELQNISKAITATL
ncbi:hypothetical protein [Pedobacter punctiformis]|uniref:DUF4252 domain-containing protein n=1 Tax=Pedobacter punctiformis TaxID=3004097 RepID=A0ABT4LA89_9SPHI|nr:hypothetical protein [Pedobacter sp. HCMS5-2]MCZ4244845.1 hypothetical protein [Pedobacter sp. HCMS5-2]